MRTNEIKYIYRLKKQEGITVVALVITIVVLLILAGVALNLAIGENGIIRHANNAKKSNDKATEEETIKMALMAVAENISQAELQKILGEDKAEVYEFGDEYIIRFLDSQRIYRADSNLGIIKESPTILTEDKTPGSLDGKGTEADPFVIMSVEDLMFLSQNTNNGKSYQNTYFKLGKTLNFKAKLSYCNSETKDYNGYLGITDDVGLLETLTNKEYAGFKPMGAFYGIFDGNNESIINLYENTDGEAGLFKSMAYGGAIKNLEITGDIICRGDNAGTISSKGNSTVKILNCISRVNIISTGSYVGGLVGTGGGIVTNCKNYGNIEGNECVGGISGGNGTISNCQNYGNIKGSSFIGGINGRYAGKIYKCENNGEIISTSSYAGGIIGQPSSSSTIVQNINYGKVTADNKVGGITGQAGRYTVNCYNFGEITANKNYSGGIAGYVTSACPTINCYNAGKIKGNSAIGGIIGDMEYTQNDTSRFINCYTTGGIEGNSNIGGIAGAKNGYGTHYIENCYWPQEYNLSCANIKTSTGKLEIKDSEAYTKEYMKTQEFLDKLNNYVDTYNQGDKVYSNGEELLRWSFDKETGYPVLIIK